MLTRLVLAGLLVASGPQATPYENDRFGISAEVPEGFAPAPAPANGDGRTFIGDSDAELRIWGTYPVQGDLAAYRAQRRGWLAQDGVRVTYADHGPGWFVLSGNRNGEVFYLRVERAETCEGDPVRAHLRLSYPETASDRFDPLAGDLAKSLRGCEAS